MKEEKFGIGKLKLAVVIVVALTIIMQALTAAVVSNIKEEPKTLIDGFLTLTYVENTGGAFGVGQNDTLSFVIVSVLLLVIIIHFLISQKEKIDKPTLIALALILAGGISNLIDRVFRGFVVDYIDISQVLEYPVFNLADSCILIGWVVLVVAIFAYWRRETKKEKQGGYHDQKDNCHKGECRHKNR